METPYRFNKNTAPHQPYNGMWERVLQTDKPLSREEKNEFFHNIYANGGRHYFRYGGWVFPFGQFLNRYLVNYKHIGWREVWAFDKTCIRYSYYTNRGILEIVQIEKKH